LKNGASIAPMISSVQANVQNDLTSPHARRLSAGDEAIGTFVDETTRLVVRYLQ
jgi:hypothetical protein